MKDLPNFVNCVIILGQQQVNTFYQKRRRNYTMNEKEQIMVASIMTKVSSFGLSKYQELFLTQMALRQYEQRRKKKEESLEQTAGKIMKRMQGLCKKTKGLQHKRNIIERSPERSLEQLWEELCDSSTVPEELLRGQVVENVMEYLLNN